ncbi:hypothetical protein J7I81_17730 [Bacillus sp. ISL-32]|nr:hypothetical protein [Bacillus sp. ISL-32]
MGHYRPTVKAPKVHKTELWHLNKQSLGNERSPLGNIKITINIESEEK